MKDIEKKAFIQKLLNYIDFLKYSDKL